METRKPHARTLQSTLESGARAGYDGRKRKKGSKVHMAMDTLGHLLAMHVTPANEQERAQVEELAKAVQEVTGEQIELAYVDQGYTGDEPAQAAQEHGVTLEVVKLPEAKRGFVLLPRRWVVDMTRSPADCCAPLAEGFPPPEMLRSAPHDGCLPGTTVAFHAPSGRRSRQLSPDPPVRSSRPGID